MKAHDFIPKFPTLAVTDKADLIACILSLKDA